MVNTEPFLNTFLIFKLNIPMLWSSIIDDAQSGQLFFQVKFETSIYSQKQHLYRGNSPKNISGKDLY